MGGEQHQGRGGSVGRVLAEGGEAGSSGWQAGQGRTERPEDKGEEKVPAWLTCEHCWLKEGPSAPGFRFPVSVRAVDYRLGREAWSHLLGPKEDLKITLGLVKH